MLGGDVGTSTFEEGGTTSRVSYRPVQGSDRILAVVAPVGLLYADVNRALLNLAVTAGPMLVLIMLVTAWFARRVSSANRRPPGLNTRLASTNDRLEEASRSSSELA